MEPYNYDLFSGENIASIAIGIGIFLACGIVGTLGFFVLGRRDWLTWTLLFVCLGTGGIIGWGVSKDAIEARNDDARLDSLIEQASDIYGIELDRETAAKLNPPFNTPATEYEEYGRVSIPFMDGSMPVVLVWNEGVLFFGVDGSGSSLPTLEDLANQPPVEMTDPINPDNDESPPSDE